MWRFFVPHQKTKSMKKKLIFIAAMGAFIIILSQCVPSLHPFFKEEDIIEGKKLSGYWASEDENTWLYIAPGREGHLLLDREKTNILSDDTTKNSSLFLVTLFELKNRKFIDLYPSDKNLNATHFYKSQTVKAHSLSKLEPGKDSIVLYFQNPDYIEQLLQERRIRIKHERLKENFVLTAPTTELQKFVVKYMDDEKAFVESDVLVRKKQVPKEIRKYFPKERVSQAKASSGTGVFWNMNLKNEEKPLKVNLENLSDKSELKTVFRFNPANDTLVFRWGIKNPPEDPEEIKEIISIEVYTKADRQRIYQRGFPPDSKSMGLAIQDIWQQLPEGCKKKKSTFELVPKGINPKGDTLSWKKGKIEFVFDYENQ